ncbi:hypothetical protein GH714_004540 [Hevea brasiliensis]|uniref:RNase H type-1 domain-containing protein n=1 Tax=Hevea brasiliensis TaxID=3981 RepID=A0A6A6KBT0_HEVBR|nr:hypothetical protein GH714_004540 [Hevea brasiliensis]
MDIEKCFNLFYYYYYYYYYYYSFEWILTESPHHSLDDSSEAAKCDKVTPPRNHLLGYEPKPFPKHSLADEPDSLADEPDPPADKPHHKPPHKPQTGYRRLLATENVVGEDHKGKVKEEKPLQKRKPSYGHLLVEEEVVEDHKGKVKEEKPLQKRKPSYGHLLVEEEVVEDHKGLKLAKRLGVPNLNVESDNLLVVQFVKDIAVPPRNVVPLILAVKNLLASD